MQQLVGIDKWAYQNEGTQNTPQPKGLCPELEIDASACQLIADSFGKLMLPNEREDAQRQSGKDKQNQAVVHGFLAVVSAGNRVDVGTDTGHNHDTVDAKGHEGQQDELEQTAICLELSDWSCHRRWGHSGWGSHLLRRWRGHLRRWRIHHRSSRRRWGHLLGWWGLLYRWWGHLRRRRIHHRSSRRWWGHLLRWWGLLYWGWGLLLRWWGLLYWGWGLLLRWCRGRNRRFQLRSTVCAERRAGLNLLSAMCAIFHSVFLSVFVFSDQRCLFSAKRPHCFYRVKSIIFSATFQDFSKYPFLF